MDFVLFGDPNSKQTAASTFPVPAAPAGGGVAVAPSTMAFANPGPTLDLSAAVIPPAMVKQSSSGQQHQQAGPISLNTAAGIAGTQPLAFGGGFGSYRQPADPLSASTPSPQQLASLVASQHAAAAAAVAAAANLSRSSSQQSNNGAAGTAFPALMGAAATATPAVQAALAQQANRLVAEQTSPFMGAGAPLPLGSGADDMPLFPSSDSASHHGHQRQSSLNSNCSSNGESNGLDIFNASPVNPPSGSFGPPIQNLSLGGGSSSSSGAMARSSTSMSIDPISSLLDGPLFPQAALPSTATTPSAVSMQPTNSTASHLSTDSSKSSVGTATPTANLASFLPFGSASAPLKKGSNAAHSLFSMAQQQQDQSALASASPSSAAWPLGAPKPISKDEETDLLSTPKAKDQSMSTTGGAASGGASWPDLCGPNNKPATTEQAWYNLIDKSVDPATAVELGSLGAGALGPTSGAPDMGTPSAALPLSLGGGGAGGGFFTPSVNTNSMPSFLRSGSSTLGGLTTTSNHDNSNSSSNTNSRPPFLRGPSRTNASAGNSASSGLSLFDASESSTPSADDDDEGESAKPMEGVEERKPVNLHLDTRLGGSGSMTPTTNGITVKSELGANDSKSASSKRPTQLSMLANSTLFNTAEAHDAPRFADIDQTGPSDSDEERELEESIRARRRQQHLMRQQGLLLDPLVHRPSMNASSSNLDIPGPGGASGAGGSGRRRSGKGSGMDDESANSDATPSTASGNRNNYLGTYLSLSRSNSSSASEEDSLLSPPIRDSAEAVNHFGSGPTAVAAAATSAAVASHLHTQPNSHHHHRNVGGSHFRSQGGARAGGGAGKGKTDPRGVHHPAPRNTAGTAKNGANKTAAGTEQDENEGNDDDGDDDGVDDEEEGDDYDEEGEGEEDDEDDDDFEFGAGKPRTGRAGGGRTSRNSRAAAAGAKLSSPSLPPAQKRRKRQSPKADDSAASFKAATMGGSHTTSNGLTVCDYVSPLVLGVGGDESATAPSPAALKAARCGTVFHRPYDLSRHRETIHAREEARLVKNGQLKVEDCVVLGKEIPAEKVMAGASEWKCEGKNGCGSVFSRKDALLRHQRIRQHGK
ncbi:hypothetical protein OC846_001676 [Tilletia horrida]|uniref:C2H2-type domain-containing protein n=1 Tax=Tilletia horrida TaxID=155126 RepID=A0AAN6GYG4_9BASI|nr:hypothetical protein OC846_001676 [Tilletia horrida]